MRLIGVAIVALHLCEHISVVLRVLLTLVSPAEALKLSQMLALH